MWHLPFSFYLWLLPVPLRKAPAHHHRSEPQPTERSFSLVCGGAVASDIYPSLATNTRVFNSIQTCPSDKRSSGAGGCGFYVIWVWNCLDLWVEQLCLKIPSSRNLRSSLLKWTWGFEQHLEASFFILSHRTTIFICVLAKNMVIYPKGSLDVNLQLEKYLKIEIRSGPRPADLNPVWSLGRILF